MTIYRAAWSLVFASSFIAFGGLFVSAYQDNILYFLAAFFILFIFSFSWGGIKCPECGRSVFKLNSIIETSWPRRKCSRCGLDFTKELFSRK